MIVLEIMPFVVFEEEIVVSAVWADFVGLIGVLTSTIVLLGAVWISAAMIGALKRSMVFAAWVELFEAWLV